MRPKTAAGWIIAAALLLSSALSAHHAAILFETTTPIRVKGTVVRYVWANPHSAIIVEEKTEGGGIRWALESSAPIGMLESRGFSKDSFKPGDPIEACGFAPKTASGSRPDAPNRGGANSGPVWLEGSDRVITARLLLTQKGPEVHWSHYGPLDLCISQKDLASLR